MERNGLDQASEYAFTAIEQKWQKHWEQALPKAEVFSKKPKKYLLVEFPYPSGDGLHVGHIRSYAAFDALARYHRLKGENVLFPMGWDAFGLPTENYALKTGTHPRVATDRNIANFRRQMKALGLSFDWSREVDTTDPKYYKWTQWIFLQLLKKGLAFQATIPINWCPKDKIGLANEEVVNGKCERCSTEVTRKMQKQWMLKITAYADRLLKDLDTVDYLPKIKAQQVNWIGKSEGAEIDFQIASNSQVIMLRGFQGSSSNEEGYFIWLKNELEKSGHSVIIPDLPEPDDPIVDDQVEHVLKHCHFDSNTVLLGQSLGSVVALKVLERIKSPIAKLVLVGGFSQPNFKDKHRPFESKFDWKFDWKEIKKNAGLVVILRDSDDYAVPHEAADVVQKHIGGEIIDCRATEPHFQGSPEPEVLRAIVDQVKVFTTRPDTIFGTTYLVVAPEHQIVSLREITRRVKNWGEVQKYVKQSAKKSDLDRTDLAKDKTGVELKGIKAINPANNEAIPIWVADYVLSSYGTGAIMAVPAHDERDNEFAKKYKLSIRRVIEPKFIAQTGESAVHPGQPFTKRESICAVVRNPKTDKYLCISWKTVHMHGLVTGGPENGEDPIEAAKREIREETGYRNVRLVRDPEFAIHSLFYHRVKKQNRWSRFQYLFFDLVDEERGPVDEQEAALHEVVWKSVDEMKNFFSVIEGEYLLNLIKNSDHIHTSQGIMRNSGQFDWQESELAGQEIVDWLAQGSKSNKPTPTIKTVIVLHGTAGHSKKNWYPWLKQELLQKDYKVVIPDLPDSSEPDSSKWLKALGDYTDELSEHTLVVGHSLGCVAALQWLQKTKKKVARLIMVAPVHPKMDWAMVDATHDAGQSECIKKFSGHKLDWKKIQGLVNDCVCLFSEDDPYIPIQTKELYEQTLKARSVVFRDKKHFNDKTAGMTEFPELLKLIEDRSTNQQAGIARPAIQYKLRDWVFSRQHYWGEPIPVVHCDECGVVPVPENQLPIELPYVEKYQPSGTGESPLANVKDWVNTICPKCKGKAKRETDTMPNWAGSSWYWLRYCDPHNNKAFADQKKLKYWTPVDLYNGGMEHTVLHLLYSRFWHKFLFDQNLVPTSEPYQHRHSHGIVLAEDGRKMSKSFGNVINPDDYVREYGADSLRMYEMFMGPFEDMIPWSARGIVGVHRFLAKVHKVISVLVEKKNTPGDISGSSKGIHQLIKKVSDDLEGFRFNTIISELMRFINAQDFMFETNKVDWEALRRFLVVLYPFAPHLASELWERLFGGDISKESWPTYDPTKLEKDRLTLAIQVNGKLRGTIEVPAQTGKDEAIALAHKVPNIEKYLIKPALKTIYVPDKLINFVV